MRDKETFSDPMFLKKIISVYPIDYENLLQTHSTFRIYYSIFINITWLIIQTGVLKSFRFPYIFEATLRENVTHDIVSMETATDIFTTLKKTRRILFFGDIKSQRITLNMSASGLIYLGTPHCRLYRLALSLLSFLLESFFISPWLHPFFANILNA